jgi:hypothetical protein
MGPFLSELCYLCALLFKVLRCDRPRQAGPVTFFEGLRRAWEKIPARDEKKGSPAAPASYAVRDCPAGKLYPPGKKVLPGEAGKDLLE